jgi:hypothetical protein
VRIFRIGDKVVSRDKLIGVVDELLADREAGSTQEEVARAYGVQRSFVSFLESLGEIRRGARVAVVGFPVANATEVKELTARLGIDFTLVFSQAEREHIENAPGAEVFNRLLETMATLRDYDVVVVMASDWRIELIEKVLGTETITLPLGPSPLRDDVTVDIQELEQVLLAILEARTAKPRSGRVSAVLREAAERAGRWNPSKKS